MPTERRGSNAAFPARTVDWYHARVVANSQGIPQVFFLVKPYLDDRKVLDLGCGVGDYLKFFTDESIGIDASYPNLSECRNKGVEAIHGDLNEALPFVGGCFGGVFCSHVLEHVDSPLNLIRESYRILEENGVIVIIVPSEHGLANMVGRDAYFGYHPEHLYSFSIRNLRSLLSKVGFGIEEAYGLPYWTDRLMGVSQRAGDMLLQFARRTHVESSLPCFCSNVVVGRKRSTPS